MGFTRHDVSSFSHVRHIYTVVSWGSSRGEMGRGDVNSLTEGAVLSPVGAAEPLVSSSKITSRQLQNNHGHDTPWLKPALLASIVTDQRTGRMQMLSQGNLPFLLANCSEYFDGTTMYPLTQNRRAALLSVRVLVAALF